MANDAAFVREFERPRVRIVDLPATRPAGLEARLLAIVQASYLSRGQTESVRIRLAEARANGIIRWLGLKGAIGRVLVEPFTRNGSRYALSDRLVSHPAMERLFDEHRPVLVVAANPGLVFSEVPLLRTARRRGVPSMAIDPSWDNFTNKLIPVRQVDRLVVWNEIMKAQAVELHGYDPDAISVAGAPQFDPHFRAAHAARRVLPPHRRRPVAQADRADHHAAVVVSPSRSRAARAGGRHRARRAAATRRCWCGCIPATRSTPTASLRACRTSSSKSRFATP